MDGKRARSLSPVVRAKRLQVKRTLATIAAALTLAPPVFAHRLDEYLQAIIVSVSQTQIRASMRLIPGVAVSSAVINAIDVNRDGFFSPAEQQTYAQGVLRDLSLTADGHALRSLLRSLSFPSAAEMKTGLGEIHIEFAADLPAGGSQRSLVIENHHQPRMSVYLMNCLVPQDGNIRLIGQNRNPNQSYYRIDFTQSRSEYGSLASVWLSRLDFVLSPFAGVPAMFRLGMRHIAEGTDHLLFLIALLLPAPLLAIRFRWAGSGDIRHSLLQILRVVTAFTIGHSVTLGLGAWGIFSLPSRPVEVLIAVSVLISAIHALRPLFPGREPMIAAAFGLVHGLAFATTLQNLGVDAWQRLASILGFNLGIETMQLIVVAAILPSLLLLSRTPAYNFFRVAGALFAASASLGWIIERLSGLDYSVDAVVNSIAQRGVWIALFLVVMGIVLHSPFPFWPKRRRTQMVSS
jgi:hypothetical protein